ncbi:bifunctional protein-disulfide isomerase/oxidoreductase DsbC [Thalassotalea sp. PLHSN55]|uniref:bifunctional protein-disulfide isomerase/oxidoreductase DsbC n=1 Tax=Thalassotalea sp. PLHSN55 TaxID=3435888 RepID=UPI003F87FDD8
MLKKLLLVLTVAFAACSAIVFAFDEPTKSQATATGTLDEAYLKEKLSKNLGIGINKVEATPLAGIALVMTDEGSFYASYDGSFFIQGKIYDLSGPQAVDLSDASLAKLRVEGMKRFANDMIVYPAENEKHVITVFTDITCGYCRQMHKQMDQYNDLGITVRYLAYPRSGVTDRNGNLSQGYKDLNSIWCHEDPAKALTKAKNGGNVAQRICDKPIKEEFDFGRQVGVNGTPAIILADGNMIPGYQPPERLIQVLENM